MKQYKGYYIDNVIFNSTEDVDNFLKQQAVENFKKLNKFFAERVDFGICQMCNEQAERLHRDFGFTWDEIEQMEIEAMTA